ncbi:lysozyme inhibitor LprI family protein [Loktanella sp. DJP18]|uniref:lysozyme inhibitor LprI family protein n=1 Tax=Loktanella sp. DJP18 TaxID=3409788 RepID=UPI003BB7E2CE
MQIWGHGALLVLICGWPMAVAAQDVVFDPVITTNCMADVDGAARLDCVGAAAGVCMTETPGGDSTVGMGACLDREFQFWDGALNAAYGDLMTLYKANDAEAEAGGWNAPRQVPALQAMQRAWIAYRDARCDFERAKWGGGTGGGPATAQCLMTVTAEQTLLLQDGLDGLQ